MWQVLLNSPASLRVDVVAEAWLMEVGEKDGVILTTDADSQVAPNWIAQNLAAFEAGGEAVLGRIDLDIEGEFFTRRSPSARLV
jgi:hypothetical protein